MPPRAFRAARHLHRILITRASNPIQTRRVFESKRTKAVYRAFPLPCGTTQLPSILEKQASARKRVRRNAPRVKHGEHAYDFPGRVFYRACVAVGAARTRSRPGTP